MRVFDQTLNQDLYEKAYALSITDPDAFWAENGKIIDWIHPFTKVKNTSFNAPVSIKWYEDGTLNACYNCVDRHLPANANKIAFYWEGDNPDNHKTITYQQLHDDVCRFANVLINHGVTKGNRVIIYMPMIVEAVYAMLACARIGAVHSVVFGGFSATALASRIDDCRAKLIITADESLRGGKPIPLKANVDAALTQTQQQPKVLVVQHTHADISWYDRDIDYYQAAENVPATCPAVEMNAEDPLFILYTSGSTGTPKGIVHTTGGYMVYAALTHKIIFDYQDDDIYWCTADVGWITGHSYIVYGPLANGATSVLYEGVPSYSNYGRWWEMVDRYKVTKFYTAPTAIRALMQQGDEILDQSNRSSLKLLGSVGEPINVDAWNWYYDKIGNQNCYIVDTWWQTETGGILMTPLSQVHKNPKPSYATAPFFGIQPVILDKDSKMSDKGFLCIKDSWPGQMRGVYNNPKRFEDTYFSDFTGFYAAGDGAFKDENGYRITGRTDDVMNISGHRIGTAEVEAAINSHPSIVESAVIGVPHPIKGECIYAFVLLQSGHNPGDALKTDIAQTVRQKIGAIASLDRLQFCSDLPKTRSGKIMRRILRKVAAGDSDMGDISTLANPDCVTSLMTEKAACNLEVSLL